MRASSLVLCGVLFLAGCWADFPDNRFNFDVGPDPDQSTDSVITPDGPRPPDQGPTEVGPTEGGPTEGGPTEGGPLPDTQPQDGTPDPDGFICTPDAFIECKDGKTATLCNAAGDGTIDQSCGIGSCQTGAGCDCDPADDDNDGYSECDGDCDDTSDLVFPGQTDYFDTPRAGSQSFDYDCSGQDEMELTDVFTSCTGFPNCVGSGWQTGVPNCGQTGQYMECSKSGNTCVPNPSTETQSCR